MSHDELVDRARKWLAARCPIVITEMSHARSETPDAIGFGWCHGSPILVECKISKSDFYADKRKAFRRRPDSGMGRFRYYMTLPGLIPHGKEPDAWGILEITEKTVRVRREAPDMRLDRNVEAEQSILVSCIRRIGQGSPDNMKIKCYSYMTDSASLTVQVP